jgi:hypothetical protein
LDQDRQASLEAFIRERGAEGTAAYRAAFTALEPVVKRIFALTEDLRHLTPGVLLRDMDLLGAARYLAVPPISEDDLRTLSGTERRSGSLGQGRATRLITILRSAMDPIRLPWLTEARAPLDVEREHAIRWTAGIWAVERIRTQRRSQSSRRQEMAVARLLEEARYTPHAGLRRIGGLDDLPGGAFCKEVLLAGTKCDVAVRIHDGRLLALECKVSNSAINSVKRLIRETGGKARIWREEFGRWVIPGAVLSGVYKLTNLAEAQNDHRLTLFWEHDLSPLRRFVQARRWRAKR